MTHLRWTVALLAGLALAGCKDTTPPTAPPPKPAAEPQGPLAEVKKRVAEVSIEDTAKTYDFAFPFTNNGDQPLELKLVKKSCSCTVVEMPKEPIAPGKTANVVFHWSPLPTTTPFYVSAADVDTNDPNPKMRHVHLEMRARVDPIIRFWPRLPYLDFLTLRPGQTGRMTLRVYSTKLPAFDLEATASPALAITKEKLPPGAPVEDVQALAGYELTLKTTDQLPPNYFRDDLVVTVKVPGQEAPQKFTLPVYALRETGAFTVIPSQIEFHKSLVTDADTKKVVVKFLAPSDNESVEVVKAEPAFLKTTAPVKVRPGEWRFEVALPADNPEAAKYQPDRFLEGRIVLKLSGTPGEVPVRVKWEPESR